MTVKLETFGDLLREVASVWKDRTLMEADARLMTLLDEHSLNDIYELISLSEDTTEMLQDYAVKRTQRG